MNHSPGSLRAFGRAQSQRRPFLVLLPALLLLYGCPGTQPDQLTGTPVPDEITGKWQTILTYVPAYWEGIIPTADFNGSLGVFFYFWPDGRYQFDLDSAVTYFGGNCFRTTSWSESGTVRIEGEAFTFQPARATYSVLDSCGESTFINADPGDAATLTVTPEYDGTGWPMLRLRYPSGDDLLVERCRDCE
jgi:hypothetical protein